MREHGSIECSTARVWTQDKCGRAHPSVCYEQNRQTSATEQKQYEKLLPPLRYSFGSTTGRSSRFGVVDVCSSSPSLVRFVYLSILLPPTTDTDSAVATCLSARALRPQIGTCWPSSLTRHLVCASAAGSGEEGEKKTCPYHSPAMPTAAAASLTASFIITISSKYDRIIMQRDTAYTNSTTSATRAPSK